MKITYGDGIKKKMKKKKKIEFASITEGHTFSGGMKHWPSGFAVFVARRAISIFSAIPALAVHPVVSKISLLITEAKSWGSSTLELVTSRNASSQLTACIKIKLHFQNWKTETGYSFEMHFRMQTCTLLQCLCRMS